MGQLLSLREAYITNLSCLLSLEPFFSQNIMLYLIIISYLKKKKIGVCLGGRMVGGLNCVFRQHAASIHGFFRQSVSFVEKKFRPLQSKV